MTAPHFNNQVGPQERRPLGRRYMRALGLLAMLVTILWTATVSTP